MEGRSEQGEFMLLDRPTPGDTDVLKVSANGVKGCALLLTLQWLLLLTQQRKIVATMLRLLVRFLICRDLSSLEFVEP